jgi:hypothetical protein
MPQPRPRRNTHKRTPTQADGRKLKLGRIVVNTGAAKVEPKPVFLGGGVARNGDGQSLALTFASRITSQPPGHPTCTTHTHTQQQQQRDDDIQSKTLALFSRP